MKAPLGIAGRLAQTFIHSKLTLLMAIAALLLGALAVTHLPREEEPQIKVPMFDIFVPFPGASAKEVEERLITIGERKLWEIPGVEYIYSTAAPNMAMYIVRFRVGTSPEEAMTRVFTKTLAHSDLLPPGAGQPIIKPRSIDDVPILALTLSGVGLDGRVLRDAAALMRQEISAVPNVSVTELIGGRRRQFLVHFDPAKLHAFRLTPAEVLGTIQASNTRLPAGLYSNASQKVKVETDAHIRTIEDLKNVVVSVAGGDAIQLSDVAQVSDAVDEEEREVWTSFRSTPQPAVTLAVSKRKGANATTVAHEVLQRIAELKPLLPQSLVISQTRNYGETAKEKSDELLFHVLLATFSVTLLIAIVLGWREALVVLIAIPVTLALTMLIYKLFGYTLNRITLFALIFSIGILVDDAIVVIENIHRHYLMKDGRSVWDLSVDAVAEVGNPTLLATWAVIAAILPMAFVGGLMGPYMRPIPVGASFAMLFSVGIAFVISPWAFAHILHRWPPKSHAGSQEGKLDRWYRRFMHLLLDNARWRRRYLAAMGILWLLSISLFYFKGVIVKMLPFDNKDEFQVIVNLPESSSFSRTREAAFEMASALESLPEVRQVTQYLGTAGPYNFNGLVRHYFLRQEPHQADLSVTLSPRKERKRQSHAIATDARAILHPIAQRYGARLQVAEIPPGPPVLSTLVFEIYGPDAAIRAQLAARIRERLQQSVGITDVDTYETGVQPKDRLRVDRQKSTLNAISADTIAKTVRLALEGQTADIAHVPEAKEEVEIRLRLAEKNRRSLDAVQSVRLYSRNGTPVPIRDLTRTETTEEDAAIYHKNLLPVSYVIADVSGRRESPVYAILALRSEIDALARSMGISLKQYFSDMPENSQETALKWDGEWQITYEVFRDLGIAFAVVMVLIYILVVAWFESLTIPLVIMIPIPLTLVGILPAHWLSGTLFSATSMIGFIAGAGIVVRNSIILVDFIQHRQREGMPLKEAVIDAGAVRFRPMLLTAAAVVAGSSVILADPIFQGLAVALMAGEVASTVLSRVAVPVLYYLLAKRQITI